MITPTDYKCPLTREKCSKNCPWSIETEVGDFDAGYILREYECSIRIIAWSVSSEGRREED